MSALVMLAILAALSAAGLFAGLRRRGRLGALGGLALSIWALSGVLALLADRAGVF